MDLLLFLAGWYATGLVGSALAFGVWWRDELDVDVDDIAFGAFMAVAGPINLGVGIALATLTLIRRAFPNTGLRGDRVVWARR